MMKKTIIAMNIICFMFWFFFIFRDICWFKDDILGLLLGLVLNFIVEFPHYFNHILINNCRNMKSLLITIFTTFFYIVWSLRENFYLMNAVAKSTDPHSAIGFGFIGIAASAYLMIFWIIAIILNSGSLLDLIRIDRKH